MRGGRRRGAGLVDAGDRGGLAVFARDGSPVNKVVGLGFAPLARDEIEDDLAALEARGPVRVELATLAAPAVPQLLSARGYRLEGFENILGQPLPVAPAATPAAATSIVVEEGEHPEWGEVAIEGFAHPDETSGNGEEIPRAAIEQVMHDMLAAAGFRRYVAYLNGRLAGVASLRIDDGVAMLSGATTLPWARRRGVQGALLGRRLADAAAPGSDCELAVMTTSPGTQSQANAHRQGFTVLYARAVLVRP